MTKTYYITASAYMHENLFQRATTAELLLKTLFRYRGRNEFLVHEFVIMPNHIHSLLSVDDGCAIGRAVQFIKGGFSHELGRTGTKLRAIWQPSYYEHRVRDAAEYARVRKYIHENPVRRGLVGEAGEYPFSSASTIYCLDEVPERLKPEYEGWFMRA